MNRENILSAFLVIGFILGFPTVVVYCHSAMYDGMSAAEWSPVQARNYVVDHSSRFQEVILDHGEAEKYIANHGLPISSDHRRAWYSFTVSPTCSGDVYVIVDAQAQFDPKPELECVGLSESGDLAVYHYRVDHNVEPFMFRTTARNVFLYHFP